MNIVIPLLYLLTLLFLILNKYVLFISYILISLIITHIYYFTYYYFERGLLIISVGLIKFKIKKRNIKKIKREGNTVQIEFSKFGIDIHPDNIKEFMKKVR